MAPAAPVLLVWVGAVAIWDIRCRRIPNLLIVVGALLGVLLMAAEGRWLNGLYGGGLALLLAIIPFALHALGGGDVKAAIVVGAFVGPTGTLKVLLLTALLCGIYAAIWWSIQRYRPSKLNSSLPVALPLALATWGLILIG